MKKQIIMVAALILAGTMATASPLAQQPENIAEQQKHAKIDIQKQRDIDKLHQDEELKAQKAKDKARMDYQAEIDKRTSAAAHARLKKETDIDRKKDDNIRKGYAALDKKYDAKHAKTAASSAKKGQAVAQAE